MSGDNGEKLAKKLLLWVTIMGENYDEWTRSLRTTLRARKKFGFVDGTIKQPDDKSLDLEDWWTNNSLIVSWITNTIEPLLRSQILHTEVAEYLWKDIKERFSNAKGPRIHQLKVKVANCKHLGLSIVAYYGKLKKLWEELGDYEQMSTCICGLCECKLVFAFAKRCEDEKVHQFLMGLDETLYGTVKSNLLAQDPLPNLNKIYSNFGSRRTCEDRGRNKGGRGGGVKANVFQSSTLGARRNVVVSDVDRVAVTELNNDQWETLKNILNATKIRVNEKIIGPHFKDADWCGVNHEEEQSVDQVFNYETNDSINDEKAQNADFVNSVLR
uniref:Retrovirus-related Pol polyprotein from transposon TNT 1-94 n=1 Tax=Tanacetum cinerariifolium TaxID=118510 RepID=A0A699I0U9_TANCI|nr:retrovirus-related Pol polyprotein from transposon TNT 1-94 [Tanacetum cinerariifolium]